MYFTSDLSSKILIYFLIAIKSNDIFSSKKLNDQRQINFSKSGSLPSSNIEINKNLSVLDKDIGTINEDSKYEFENNTFTTPIYLSSRFKYKYSNKGHRYEIYRDI